MRSVLSVPGLCFVKVEGYNRPSSNTKPFRCGNGNAPLFAHAGEGSKSERLLDEQLGAGKLSYVIEVPSNGRHVAKGAEPIAAGDVGPVLKRE